jgi:hypothetical protein
MMALGLSINMDLGFFRGNGIVMTLAPLDISKVMTFVILHFKIREFTW